jgi:HK97 family phage major capsid protein
MPMPALEELQERKEAKEQELFSIFDQADPDGSGNIDLKKVKTGLPSGVKQGDTHALASWIRERNDELTKMGKEWDDLAAVNDLATKRRNANADSDPRNRGSAERGDDGRFRTANWGGDGASLDVSIGDLFVKSSAYTALKGRKNGDLSTLDIELKTLMQTSAGWAPEVTRTGKVVDFATRPLQVSQLIPQTTTRQNAIQYMEETTFTNAAAETAEAGTYPEAALVLTERSSLVRKISVFLPITDEQLEDETQARGYIDNRLGFMVRQRLDGQILVGNGTPPNLLGFLATPGIQTQAKGADPTPDAVYKAMTKIRVIGQAEPNLVVMHPNDWQDIRLLRTTDGIYIWGNPSDAGPERIWGLSVSQAQAETENTGLVMDTMFTELSTRRGLDIQVSNSHAGFFIEGKQAVRADMRVAVVVYRPAALCTVTGI